MPVKFVRQNACENGKCASTRLMLDYDGSGRRISKTRMMKTAADGDWYVDNVTHYTGIGTEVRENYNGGSTAETKVVMNLPQGLGRYMPEDAVDGLNGVSGSQLAGYRPPAKFEWYLKNHIGSTMLVYGTSAYNDPYASGYKGGVKAAYDYRAFGEQVDLTEPTDKVTENFTGKEKDDETELNYFGARYLDPMLGMWTSVDPMREFWHSHAYGPADPINGFDSEGLYWEFAINSGRLTYIDNSTGERTLVAFGYAGRDEALNVSDYQYVANIGPLPNDDLLYVFSYSDEDDFSSTGNLTIGEVGSPTVTIGEILVENE